MRDPGPVPAESFASFGIQEWSGAAWWSYQGAVNIVFVDGQVPELARLSIIEHLCTRPELESAIREIDTHMVDILMVRRHRGYPEHPGQEVIERLFNQAFIYLGGLAHDGEVDEDGPGA